MMFLALMVVNNQSFDEQIGAAYSQSCEAALHLATRNNSNDNEYQGHGYSDSKAAAEDSHYHNDPSSYDGRHG